MFVSLYRSRNLTDRQRELIEEFQKEEQYESSDKGKAASASG
jgi:hypothetical protein